MLVLVLDCPFCLLATGLGADCLEKLGSHAATFTVATARHALLDFDHLASEFSERGVAVRVHQVLNLYLMSG